MSFVSPHFGGVFPYFYHIFTFFEPGGLTNEETVQKNGSKNGLKKSSFYRVGVLRGRTLKSPESRESPESPKNFSDPQKSWRSESRQLSKEIILRFKFDNG